MSGKTSQPIALFNKKKERVDTTFVTPEGKLDTPRAYRTLNENLFKVPYKSRKFASSLLQYHDFTSEQKYYLHHFAMQIIEQSEAHDYRHQPLMPILDLFQYALKRGVNASYLKIEFLAGDDVLVLNPYAPSNALIAVYINSSDSTAPDYGRILANGMYEPPKQRPMDVQVTTALTELAKNPPKVFEEFGERTGRCAMCGRGLESDESQVLKYGAICAAKFGIK
jgi:hypothetical protein